MGLLRRMQNWLWPTNGRPPAGYDLYEQLREADAEFRAKRLARARDLLLKAAEQRPGITDPRVVVYINTTLTSIWMAEEQFDAAITYFSEYIANYPTEFEPFRFRAINFWYAGRLAEAISDYSRALDFKPDDLSALSARGQTYAECGEFEKAMHDLDLVLRELENSPPPDSEVTLWFSHLEAYTRNGRGLALGGLGEVKRAMEEFELSNRLAGENAWLNFNRAQIHERFGNFPSAAEDYREALEKNGPQLTPLKRARALSKISELSHRQ